MRAFTQHYQREDIHSTLVLAGLYHFYHGRAFAIQASHYHDALFKVTTTLHTVRLITEEPRLEMLLVFFSCLVISPPR